MSTLEEIRDLLNATPLHNLRAMADYLQQIVADRRTRDRGHAYDWNSLSSPQLEDLRRTILEALEARSAVLYSPGSPNPQ